MALAIRIGNVELLHDGSEEEEELGTGKNLSRAAPPPQPEQDQIVVFGVAAILVQEAIWHEFVRLGEIASVHVDTMTEKSYLRMSFRWDISAYFNR